MGKYFTIVLVLLVSFFTLIINAAENDYIIPRVTASGETAESVLRWSTQAQAEAAQLSSVWMNPLTTLQLLRANLYAGNQMSLTSGTISFDNTNVYITSTNGAPSLVVDQTANYTSPVLRLIRSGTAGDISIGAMVEIQAGAETEWNQPIMRLGGCLALSGDNWVVFWANGALTVPMGIYDQANGDRELTGKLSIDPVHRQLVGNSGTSFIFTWNDNSVNIAGNLLMSGTNIETIIDNKVDPTPYDFGVLASGTLNRANGILQSGTLLTSGTIYPPTNGRVGRQLEIWIVPSGSDHTIDFSTAIKRPDMSSTTFPKNLTQDKLYIIKLWHNGTNWMLVSLVGGY